MSQVLVGGLTAGAIYALLALGLVTVFRVAKFLNLAQGEFYVWGALLATTFVAAGWPLGLAVVAAILITSLLGAVLYRLVFRRVSSASHAMQLLVSLGVALAMSGAARLLWGTSERSLPPFFRSDGFTVLSARVGAQTLVVWATLAGLCVLLWWLLQRTMFGKTMAAAASNPAGAGLLGVNLRAVGTVSFAIAAALGAIAGVTVAPQVFVTYQSGLLLTVFGFIAAAVGGMNSVPGAIAGGLALGLLEALVAYYVDSALKTPIAFALLIAVLLYRTGRSLSFGSLSLRRRVPAAGSAPPLSLAGRRRTPLTFAGQGRPGLVGIVAVVAFALAGRELLPPYWMSVWTFIGVFVIVGLGLDLLLGFTGQLSVGQTAFLGVAAYLVALSEKWWAVSGWGAVGIAVAGTALLAAVLGAVVLRLRGYYFALATLAVSLAAEALASGLPDLFGGPSGAPVYGQLGVFGFDLAAPDRLFAAVWVIVAVGLVVGGRLMRSRFGQAMVAVGSDETSAAAASIHPFPVRLKVFVLSAVYAAVGGVLLAHSLRFVTPPALGFHGGIDALVGLLLGGFGTLWGAVIGIPLVRLLSETGERFAEVQQLIYGFAIVAIVLVFPEGIVGGLQRVAARLRPRPQPAATRPSTGPAGAVPARPNSGERPGERTHALLRAESLSKSFGGLRAVDDVNLAVAPGRILGLIGPNGAGKSTCLGLLAGALEPDRGRIFLDDEEITALPAASRAALGLARTFQLPRLVANLTALDTVALGGHRRGRSGLLSGAFADLGWRERAALRAAAEEALELVGLAHLRDVPAHRLSTGQQKLLELARAVANHPVVLLADEPAGGLFEQEVDALGAVLQRLAGEGIGVLLVEHEMGLVMSVCDEVVVLSEGRVIGAGTPDEVRASQEVIDAYLGV